jgi:hypothetical protein
MVASTALLLRRLCASASGVNAAAAMRLEATAKPRPRRMIIVLLTRAFLNSERITGKMNNSLNICAGTQDFRNKRPVRQQGNLKRGGAPPRSLSGSE